MFFTLKVRKHGEKRFSWVCKFFTKLNNCGLGYHLGSNTASLKFILKHLRIIFFPWCKMGLE